MNVSVHYPIYIEIPYTIIYVGLRTEDRRIDSKVTLFWEMLGKAVVEDVFIFSVSLKNEGRALRLSVALPWLIRTPTLACDIFSKTSFVQDFVGVLPSSDEWPSNFKFLSKPLWPFLSLLCVVRDPKVPHV